MVTEKVSYLKFEASSDDVFKQNIGESTRKLARSQLEASYIKALELPSDEAETPEQVVGIVKDIEEELYKEFNKKPVDYVRQIAKLDVFLNPKHYVGQFAKMFRVKTLQSVYTARRLIQLDITDMLPEVFLNPTADPAAKLDIYQNINRLISEAANDLRVQMNVALDPTARRPTQPKPIRFEKTGKLIAKNQRDVKELCENPYWDMKKVNMIICKENSKFYCLDIEQLLAELAEKKIATNYFTGKELVQEVIDNLRTRFHNEIEELSKGQVVEIGGRTLEEMVALEKTIQKLEEFRTILNKEKVIEHVNLFGLDSVEDLAVGGKKDILDNLPPMIRDLFDEYIDDDDIDTALKKINDWLNRNIVYITDIVKGIKGSADQDLEDEEQEARAPIEALVGEEEVLVAPKEETSATQLEQEEEKLAKEEILKENTISFAVYNDYLNRLEILSKSIMETLQHTQNLESRETLNANLLEINAQLKEVRSKGRTIKGIITLLQSALSANNERLSKITAATGMEKLYPQQIEAAQQEKAELEEFVKQLQIEIAYLEELHSTFIEKSSE